MNALTICQPYASLICLPESNPLHKRVENRKWFTGRVGKLVIHAVKSRDFLKIVRPGVEAFGFEVAKLPFGALVAVVDMVGCFSQAEIYRRDPKTLKFPWLQAHRHVEGPYCFVLQNVRVFAKPIPYTGHQGFFDVPDDLVKEALGATATPQATATV